MANKKISELTSISTMDGSETVPLVQSGSTRSSTVKELFDTATAFTPAGSGAVDRTATDKLRETVSVKDFGAVGDGVTDDTAAIQAALDAVADGGTIYGGVGETYSITSNISVGDKSFTFDARGSRFVQDADIGIFTFFGSFSDVTDCTVSGGTVTVAVGSDILAALDAVIDDNPVVKVVSDDALDNVTSTDKRRGEFARVTAVNTETGVITLAHDVVDTYTTNPRIAMMATNKVVVKDAVFDTGDLTYLASLIFCAGLYEPEFHNIKCVKNGHTFMVVRSCYNTKIIAPSISNLTNNLGAGRTGYGIDDASSHYTTVIAPYFHNCRHGYTTSTRATTAGASVVSFGRTRYSKVIDGIGHACTAAAFDSHPEAEDIEFINCSTYGNTVTGGYQLRADRHKLVNCCSIGDLRAFDVGDINVTRTFYLENCYTQDVYQRIAIISAGHELCVTGGDYHIADDSSNLGWDIRDEAKLVLKGGARSRFTGGTNTARSLIALTEATGTLEVDGGELDISGLTTSNNRMIHITSGCTADITVRYTRLTFGAAAAESTTSFLRNDSSDISVMIADDLFIDAFPSSGNLLMFGDSFGTYASGSGYSYRTRASRTVTSATL